jgi:GNAT superfamily N-acetyltransferase
MTVDVVPFADTDEATARQVYEIHRASALDAMPDAPPNSWHTFWTGMRMPSASYDVEWVLARLDRRPVGYLSVNLPLLDNLDNLSIDLRVAPGMRRCGVGRALYAYAVARAAAHGRTLLDAETVDSPASSAFAEAMGSKQVLAETRSRLDVATVDQDRLDKMLAEALPHAAGYRFVRWDGVPPDEWIDDVAALDSRFFTDAPQGDFVVEPEKVDAERIRRTEQNRLDRGFGRYHGGIVHEGSGRLVGWTTLAGADDTPTHLWQNITLVDPEHRGHRLGLILKLENLGHAREHRPGLIAVDTINASSNAHMLKINVAMGFRPVDTWLQWQHSLAAGETRGPGA